MPIYTLNFPKDLEVVSYNKVDMKKTKEVRIGEAVKEDEIVL